jgi:hypothetical protein
MSFLLHLLTSALTALLSIASLLGQAGPDVTGHWEGIIHAPEMAVNFEVDFARNSKGVLVGTVNLPAERIRHLPLTTLAVSGSSITFHARSDQPLTGVVSVDGKTITGDMSAMGGTAPFTLTRTGEPQIDAPARNAPVARALEGDWHGSLASRLGALRLVLSIANDDDGATARIVNLDQGSLEIPASTITVSGSKVTLEFTSIGASYAATLGADGSELVGTFSEARGSAPLSFTRASQ